MIRERTRQALLSPVLAVQAVRVIRKTPKLPEATGPRSGAVGQGPDLKLLIVGDSSAAGVGVATQQQALSGQIVGRLAVERAVHWRLIARTGMTTRALPAFLEGHAAGPASVAVTALGVNDATRLVSPRSWVAQTRRLHQVLRGHHGIRRIYVTSMPPLARFRALPRPLSTVLGAHADGMWAALEAEVCADDAVRTLTPDWGVDPGRMAEDGYHPGPEIYRDWGSFMAERILEDLRQNPLPPGA